MGKLVPVNTGDRFGRWTVLQRTEGSGGHGNKVYYDCICDCGTKKSVCGTSLRSGASQSCGCYKKEKSFERRVDITGQRFGRLVALYPSEKQNLNDRAKWHCKCDCGNEIDIVLNQLTRTDREGTKSCGCLQKEKLSKMARKDITGMRSGLLTALYPTEERNCEQGVMWMCKCECGNFHKVATVDITSQKICSCGCLTKSHGELKIAQILSNANIQYEMEKTFDSCRFPETNKYARFDFYINNQYLIEYDGSQHFIAADSGWNTKENLLNTQKRDSFKNQWCKEHGIPLIRIPYTHYNNLCIEDLILETSKFIIK